MRRLSVVKTAVTVEFFRVPQIFLALEMVVHFLGPLGEEHVGFDWCSATFSETSVTSKAVVLVTGLLFERLCFTTSDHVVAAPCLL